MTHSFRNSLVCFEDASSVAKVVTHSEPSFTYMVGWANIILN